MENGKMENLMVKENYIIQNGKLDYDGEWKNGYFIRGIQYHYNFKFHK